ncbi:hypothetical protein SCMU_13790 [Sinomonas cyclohexanicum]|uniref:Uncharacterized protein n=1 Tax=Sinomonas cyclohexanicum TaxID=322009 RepID=A0ABN6FHJ5_SINCY|nr:hypothetical protein [Corynebacterium cyclohexanicum]BCT75537.1 hypothetical protein SCMU_13790 [Corynebacterium cyclohexanicum]
MPLGNYQVVLPNGTIVGAGTTVNLTAIRGLRSLINTRTGDVPKAQQDGAFPGYNLLGVRVVQIDWLVFNPAVNTESAMANLTAGWQNVKDPTTVVLRVGDWLRQQANIGPTLPVSSLQIQLPGRAYPILVFGRPTKLDTPVDLNFQYGNVTAPPSSPAPTPSSTTPSSRPRRAGSRTPPAAARSPPRSTTPSGHPRAGPSP